MSEVICHPGAARTVLFNQTSQLHKFSAVELELKQCVSLAHFHAILALHLPTYALTHAGVFPLSSRQNVLKIKTIKYRRHL